MAAEMQSSRRMLGAVPIFAWAMAACAALLLVLAFAGYQNARATMLRQDLQHTLVPGSDAYAAASAYRQQLQAQSVQGQIAYEKKKAAQRAIAMQKGMKQAKALYSYTQQHGYGKDQLKQMEKTLDALSTHRSRASDVPHHWE